MGHARTRYAPLTLEEQCFAESNHYLVEQFLRWNQLKPDDWYDVVIFRYLLSVKKWIQRPDLHRWKFSTIVKNDLRSAVGNERKRRSREIQAISLEEIVPGTEGVTYMDMITADNLDYINYGEEDMNISYDVIVPEKKRKCMGRKSDEVIALESFLATKKMKNMRIEYDTEEEAKKKLPNLQSYRRTKGLKEQIEIFRVEANIYIVRLEKGKEK